MNQFKMKKSMKNLQEIDSPIVARSRSPTSGDETQNKQRKRGYSYEKSPKDTYERKQ